MERFRAKATAYLREHEDHITLQRLRRGRQLTPEDLDELEEMLISSGVAAETDIEWVSEQSGGLGMFVRGLVGLERSAVNEAFGSFLDGSRYSVDQVRFVGLIVEELTRNGVMEPGRLFESPYTDHAPTGPDFFFPVEDVTVIVEKLEDFRRTAVPEGVA